MKDFHEAPSNHTLDTSIDWISAYLVAAATLDYVKWAFLLESYMLLGLGLRGRYVSCSRAQHGVSVSSSAEKSIRVAEFAKLGCH